MTFAALVDTVNPPASGTLLHSVATVFTSGYGGAVANSAVAVSATPALMLGLVDGPDAVMPGAALTYTLTMGNPSGVTAPAGVLSMAVPTGTTFVSASGGGSLVGNMVQWSIGALAAGASSERQLVVQVAPGAASGSMVLGTADFSAGGVSSLARATAATAVAAGPTTAISLVATPDPVKPGERVFYTLTVTNRTANTIYIASGDITAIVPDHATVASGERSNGVCNGSSSGTCAAGDTIYWGVGSLAAGQSASVTFAALVDTVNPPVSGTLLHSVATEFTSGYGGAVANSAVAVSATPALMLGLVDGPDAVMPGAALTYTLTMGNPSGVTAPAGVLSMAVPTGTTFVSASGGGGLVGNMVQWSIGALAAGASSERQLVVQVAPGAASGSMVLGTADFSAGGVSSLARATAATAVAAGPVRPLSLVATPDPVKPGERVFYTLTVTNRTANTIYIACGDITAIVPDHTTVASGERSSGVCNSSSSGTCARGGHDFLGCRLIWRLGRARV